MMECKRGDKITMYRAYLSSAYLYNNREQYLFW